MPLIGMKTHTANRLSKDVRALKAEIHKLKKELEPLEAGTKDWEKALLIKGKKKAGYLSKEKEKEILEG